MFAKKETIELLNNKIEKLNKMLEKSNIDDLSYILGSKRQIFIRNFMAGISRGVGIGIGITIISAIIVYILQNLIKLNIPVIGEYLTDLIQIVETRNL